MKRSKPGGNKINPELEIAAIPPPNMDAWFKKSLRSEFLFKNIRRERYFVKTDVRGTCTQDCILIALAWQYIDDERFRIFISKNIRTASAPAADFARFIAVLAHQGARTHICRWREQLILRECFSSLEGSTKRSHCGSSLGEQLKQLVTPLFPSMTTISGCGCRLERKFTTIPIEFYQLKDFGLVYLQIALDVRVARHRKLCKLCGQKHSESRVFSDIVFVYVEPILNLFSPQEMRDFMRIPGTIILNGQQYHLTCFIDIDKDIDHATTFCRRKDEWYHYDDMTQSVVPKSTENTSPACLMYRKTG